MRIVMAMILRVAVAFGVALAVALTVFTAAGVALIASGRLDLAASYSVGELLILWLASTALLLAVSRLAHLLIIRIVDAGRPHRPDGE